MSCSENDSTNSGSSPSREADFDEYGQFGYALEPEYTEEELHEMEAAESSRNQDILSNPRQFNTDWCSCTKCINGSGDANDVWILEVVGGSTGAVVQTVRSQVRLIHYHVRCALQSHDKKLPKWGWEQLEVTCNPNKNKKTLWSVEEVTDQKISFIFKGNSGLKPKEGEITSRPWQWPINYRGQIFSGKDHRIYLLGNPVIFWGCLGLTFVFIIAYAIDTVKSRRGLRNNKYWRGNIMLNVLSKVSPHCFFKDFRILQLDY
ncbi:POMT [Mytilus edulis]|uniref:POMT n=1 Tax=Mytilus edulis TaxID=6550 RepID=A0A8S3S219_MYTED|nr:POMT [Mytilus edulis]